MLGNLLLSIIIALIFLAFIYSYYPFREKLQFDTDEGLNLMRSMLVALGHPLYSEVSSDQPPLFTQILGLLFRVVGFEVNPARLLVLLFSTLLVWAGAQFLQLTWGKLTAILFLPLIFMVPRYLELSVSVMIGIPSIALAVVSMLFVILWHQKKSNLWLALSGFALALSVLVKLFTGFLAPIFLIGITVSAYFDGQEDGFSWKKLRPAMVWGICFASLGLLLGLVLVGPKNVWLIVFPHIAAPAVEEFQGEGNTINTHLQTAVPLIFLGLLGALISVYKRNWLALYPFAWSALAYVLFSFHSPVFYHHQLMITIPLTMMAAGGVGEGIHSVIRLRRISDLVRLQTLLGAGALIGFVLVLNHYLPVLDKEIMNKPRIDGFTLKATAGKLKILETMNEYTDRTSWIMTDMPMYAFRVGRPVPPNLATFSQKRLATGSLTEEDILAAMREYRPEQVLMARFEIPALEAYLQEDYTLILSEEFFRLFLRNDLKPEVK
jgi:4-amino-4-deoxy-L-arabinose transferase-like glycosyltransferase